MTSWRLGCAGANLKASWVIVCLLLLTYLRVSTRCLAVNQALRLSSILNQCDSADVTLYWMSRLSREVLLFFTWFINTAFGNKWEIYKLNSERTKWIGVEWKVYSVFIVMSTIIYNFLSCQFYLCICVCVHSCEVYIYNHLSQTVLWACSVQLACCRIG